MAYTYAQIQERVAETVGDTRDRSLKLADDAIRAAVNELNSQVWWMQFESGEDVTLVTNTREYALSATPARIVWAWVLNSDLTNTVHPVIPLTREQFIRSGYETNTHTGLPNHLTWDEEASMLRFDRNPTSAESGRKVRVSYYKSILNPLVSTGDILGGLIVECATWRIHRVVPGWDWVSDRKVADAEKLRVRSMKRVESVIANGAR